MKNSFLLLGFFFFLFSCNKELKGEIEMKLGEKRTDSEISLTVTGISDSRCPIDANCFQEGWYEVTFDAEKDNSVVTFVLGSGDHLNSDTIVFNHEFILTEVTPYPTGNDNSNDKSVHLKVNKQ